MSGEAPSLNHTFNGMEDTLAYLASSDLYAPKTDELDEPFGHYAGFPVLGPGYNSDANGSVYITPGRKTAIVDLGMEADQAVAADSLLSSLTGYSSEHVVTALASELAWIGNSILPHASLREFKDFNKKYANADLVPLIDVKEAGAAVCHHRALFLTGLVHNLIAEGALEGVEASIDWYRRSNGGYHSFVRLAVLDREIAVAFNSKHQDEYLLKKSAFSLGDHATPVSIVPAYR